MELKATLKAIKLNEPIISTILGALVVLAIGILVVNYLRSRPSTGTITPPVQTQEETKAKVGGKHTVVSGEHLWAIAEKYYQSGYNWVDIAQANNLTNANLLAEGMELAIPDVPAKQSTVEATVQQAQAPPTSEPIQGDTYTVVKGDHLWGIAVRAYGDGYKWVEIAKLNSFANPNLIYPDQEIKLPPKS